MRLGKHVTMQCNIKQLARGFNTTSIGISWRLVSCVSFRAPRRFRRCVHAREEIDKDKRDHERYNVGHAMHPCQSRSRTCEYWFSRRADPPPVQRARGENRDHYRTTVANE